MSDRVASHGSDRKSRTKGRSGAHADGRAAAKAILESAVPPPVILVTAPDRVRRERFVALFWERFFQPSLPQEKSRTQAPAGAIDLSAISSIRRSSSAEFYDARAVTKDVLRQMRAEMSSYSLFASKRMFVIDFLDEADKACGDEIAALAGLAREPNCLVFLASSLPAASPLRKRSTVLEFAALKGHELTRWTEREMHRLGLKSFSDDVITRLIDVSEQNPDTIVTNAEKLALYCSGDQVQDAEAAALFQTHAIHHEFELLDAICGTYPSRPASSASNPGARELLVNDLLTQGVNPFMLLAILTKSFVNYLLTSYLLQHGRSSDDIAGRLQTSSWAIGKFRAAAGRYGMPELVRNIVPLLRADSKLKGKALGPEVLLSELISELAPQKRT